MNSDRESQLEALLAHFLKPLRGVPFEVVIRSLFGVAVERFDTGEPECRAILAKVVEAGRRACRVVQRSPIERSRPNEVGNDMEAYVLQGLETAGLNAAAPRTRRGWGKPSGYPDIRIQTQRRPVFLEVKTFSKETHDGTQRSFYLSPTDDPKVHEDGYHLIIAFEIERSGNKYHPVGFEVVDLYGLECDMKSEFNSDNRRLYGAGRVLARENVPR